MISMDYLFPNLYGLRGNSYLIYNLFTVFSEETTTPKKSPTNSTLSHSKIILKRFEKSFNIVNYR